MNMKTHEGKATRYARWVIRHRWWMLAASLLMTVAAGAGATKLGLASDYRVFFSEDNPDLAAYEAVENIYTKNDNVLIAIKPATGEVFTPRVLEAVRALTEDAWQVPFATRVDAITNFQHTRADGDELIVEDLVGRGPITADVVSRAREVALNEPLLLGRMIAPDARTTGINVRISLPGDSVGELPATGAFVRDLLDDYRELYPELEMHAAGIAMMNLAFAEAPLKDIPVVMPLMFIVFTLAIVLFLRNFSGVVATFAVIMFSTVTAVGMAGHMGLLFDPTSSSAPTIILTLAVADSIHILVTWLKHLRHNPDKREALVEALEVNTKPVFLTSLTTVIGFLTLNFSDSPPFQLLGNITAFGVAMAWLYSMTLLPAVVAILPTPKMVKSGSGRLEKMVDGFSGFMVRQYRPVLATMTVVALALSFSITKLVINDHYVKYFSTDLDIRQASDFTAENLTGVFNVTYSLPAGGSQDASDPAYLRSVDEFANYLEGRPDVVHVNSFTRTMKRLNMNMHGDDPAEYRLPDTRELAAQYLLLYEVSLPYGLDVNDQIDIDKSSLRVDLTFSGDNGVASVEREDFLARQWLAENGTPSMRTASATGVPVMFAKITRRNISSMVLGTGFGFVLMAVILMIALRSPRMGLISLIPNIMPAAMAFGVWALLVGEVGFAVSIIAGLSIGIIVDDTVHFLSKYNHARDAMGMEAPEAVRYAFGTVGTAIIGTTIIVGAGFAMLGLSTFRVTSYMGLLTSLTVAIALVVDFFLLPALLLAVDGKKAEEHKTDEFFFGEPAL